MEPGPPIPRAAPPTKFLGLGSAIGLVVANMVGAGVFLGAGFMAQELSPGGVLGAWVVGMLLAMAGARAYAEVAFLIPRSGGEYRYLSELLHPAVGYVAGWASLLVGFAAPMAISAFSASAFVSAVVGFDRTRLGATLLIVLLTVFHAIGLRTSKWTQNSLVLIKGGLVLGFITLGLLLGDNRWPSWEPPSARADGVLSFATSLLFVAYAFSGWNAATYTAEEVDEPRRNVPRAMLIGCAIVGIAYAAVNWILVTNLTPARAQVVFEYEEAKVTLGHLVARDLLGDSGSSLMSLGIALMLVSSTSAMLLVGPRVYAEMAHDGFLPRWLSGSVGAPPRASIVLQGVLALALLHLHTVGELLSNVAGVLVLFSGLVAGGLFFVSHRRPDLPRPRRTALAAAAVYVGFSVWMLYGAFEARAGLFPWLAAAIIAALFGYALTRKPVN